MDRAHSHRSSTRHVREIREKESPEKDDSPSSQQHGWTASEDDVLYNLYMLHGENWELIAGHFPDRRKSMILFHWNNFLKDKLLNEGKLTSAGLVHSKKEEKKREPQIQNKPWTHENDELLFKMWMQKPDDFLAIKKHFPSRTISAAQ